MWDDCDETLMTNVTWVTDPPWEQPVQEPFEHDQPRRAYVYLAQPSSPGPTKIGWTINLHRRELGLRREYKDPGFTIQWHAYGGWALEQRIHLHFSRIRLGLRELFDFTGMDPIDEIRHAYTLLTGRSPK